MIRSGNPFGMYIYIFESTMIMIVPLAYGCSDFNNFRVVRLMKAGSSQGAEEVTAEFLFVLCKESGML